MVQYFFVPCKRKDCIDCTLKENSTNCCKIHGEYQWFHVHCKNSVKFSIKFTDIFYYTILNTIEMCSQESDKCTWFTQVTYFYRLASIVIRRALTSFRDHQKQQGQSLPNLECSIRRERRPEIVYFMTLPTKVEFFVVKRVK